MARKKKNKFPIPADRANEILNMPPDILTKEIARKELNIEAQKKEISEDPTARKLKEEIETLTKELIEEDETLKALKNAKVEAENKLNEALDEMASEELSETKAKLKDWKKGIGTDLRADKKELKFLLETFKKHVESGVIKLV